METFSVSLAICAVNSPVTGEFPAQRPVTWSFRVFFDLSVDKRFVRLVIWDVTRAHYDVTVMYRSYFSGMDVLNITTLCITSYTTGFCHQKYYWYLPVMDYYIEYTRYIPFASVAWNSMGLARSLRSSEAPIVWDIVCCHAYRQVVFIDGT